MINIITYLPRHSGDGRVNLIIEGLSPDEEKLVEFLFDKFSSYGSPYFALSLIKRGIGESYIDDDKNIVINIRRSDMMGVKPTADKSSKKDQEDLVTFARKLGLRTAAEIAEEKAKAEAEAKAKASGGERPSSVPPRG